MDAEDLEIFVEAVLLITFLCKHTFTGIDGVMGIVMLNSPSRPSHSMTSDKSPACAKPQNGGCEGHHNSTVTLIYR